MTNVDPNSHPDQSTFRELFEMFDTLTRYLQHPGNAADVDLIEQIVESCDDAARYYGNEHCEVPPSWLVALRELFAAILVKARQQRVVSAELH